LIQTNRGEVVSIRGSVIDARFQNHLPEVKRCGGGPRCKQAGHVPAAAKLIEFNQTHLLKSFFFFRCSLRFDIIANYVR